jgi:ABC-type multidrug transport system fused ATPase/permease subunit
MQTNDTPQRSRSTSLKKLLSLLRPHIALFSFGMLALLLGAGVNLVLPEAARRAISPEHGELLQKQPTTVALFFVALFILQAIAFYLRTYLFGIVGQRVVATLRSKLYIQIINQPITFFDSARVGELVSRLTSDTALIQDAVSIKLSVLIRYSVQVLIGVALMLYFSPRLSITLLLILPILVMLSMILGKKLRALSKIQQTQLAAATIVAEETFGGMRIVKAFDRIAGEIIRFNEVNSKTLSAGIARAKLSAFFQSFVSFLMNSAIVGVLAYGVVLVHDQTLSVSDLTAFLMYALIVAVSFAFVAGGFSEFIQALGALDKVFEYIEAAPTSSITSKIYTPLPSLRENTLHINDLTFAYPSRSERTVLHNVSFAMPPGSVTALVGPSGSGKSSLVNILLGFYPVDERAITLGNTPLTEQLLERLRSSVGLVPQEGLLFGTSIRENLRYGRSDATDAEILALCDKLNLSELIKSLPEGLSTTPGERGIQLSGGQRQRLAIVRALLKNPDLLILDEATSALDSENESLVQELVADTMRGKTMLIIAHRLATVKDADRVIVLDRGTIVQQGTHEELCKIPGLYRAMVERQELL